jgi:hypothetical protein
LIVKTNPFVSPAVPVAVNVYVWGLAPPAGVQVKLKYFVVAGFATPQTPPPGP